MNTEYSGWEMLKARAYGLVDLLSDELKSEYTFHDTEELSKLRGEVKQELFASLETYHRALDVRNETIRTLSTMYSELAEELDSIYGAWLSLGIFDTGSSRIESIRAQLAEEMMSKYNLGLNNLVKLGYLKYEEDSETYDYVTPEFRSYMPEEAFLMDIAYLYSIQKGHITAQECDYYSICEDIIATGKAWKEYKEKELIK